MEEHPHKRLVTLAIVLIIAVIIGFIYYFSMPKSQYGNRQSQLSPQTEREILNTLQSTTTQKSLNSPAKETAILKTLEGK